MTVPLITGPIDLAGLRATANKLIEEINAAIAAGGGGGGSFPLVAPDAAIALEGSDATSGFSLDAAGQPGMTNAGTTTAQMTATTFEEGVPGLELSSSTGQFSLSIVPAVGSGGSTIFQQWGFGDKVYWETSRANGVRGAPTQVFGGDVIFSQSFNTPDNGLAAISVVAAEIIDGTHGAASYHIQTTDTVSENLLDRLFIDGTGDTKQKNGVFALDTGGNDAGVAVGALPGADPRNLPTVAGAGAGGTDGPTVLTVVGGTGTPVTFNGTITGGVLASVDSIASHGAMTSIPANPIAVTSSDAGPLIGATINITWLQTLGMMAVVNDATAPAGGAIVAGGGAATALVWWNGAQWTVMGI